MRLKWRRLGILVDVTLYYIGEADGFGVAQSSTFYLDYRVSSQTWPHLAAPEWP